MKQPVITQTIQFKLLCSSCGKEYSSAKEQTFATCCNKTILVEYDLAKANFLDVVKNESNNIWRYGSLLPVRNPKYIVSLNEGMTPILSLKKLANKYGYKELMLKDESVNPTGSFKARGLSVAISKAKEFGRTSAIIPTAGNAGGALAAYCAKADIECTVIMPRHTPKIFKQECELFGAKLILVDGLINDCGKKAMELNKENQHFDFSTLKEPYRLEGKKTMGYEIAEQYNWDLPEYIIYPAGGGTGLIGIWKAFKELKQMGIIKGPLSKMVAVQSTVCAPIYKAVMDSINWKDNFIPKVSIANGLAVPFPFGMDLILSVLKESNGRVCVVAENEILENIKEIGSVEGMILSPEGAATWQAVKQLVEEKIIQSSDRILILNTGIGYKYFENL